MIEAADRRNHSARSCVVEANVEGPPKPGQSYANDKQVQENMSDEPILIDDSTQMSYGSSGKVDSQASQWRAECEDAPGRTDNPPATDDCSNVDTPTHVNISDIKSS